MGISFEFPTPLAHGDCICVIGKVGPELFAIKLESKFLVYDPSCVRDCECDSKIPVTNTTPLRVVFSTSGEWDIAAETPETSSIASGLGTVQRGFQYGQQFNCEIVIQKNNFEVYLNQNFVSCSDHMIPVSCVESVLIEGDCLVEKLFFGDVVAVKSSLLKAAKDRNINENSKSVFYNLSADIIECRIKDEILLSNESLNSPFDSSQLSGDQILQNVISENNNLSSVLKLPSLRRTSSYQLVFDVNLSDNEDLSEASDFSIESPISKSASCCMIPELIKSEIYIPNKPFYLINKGKLINQKRITKNRSLTNLNYISNLEDSSKLINCPNNAKIVNKIEINLPKPNATTQNENLNQFDRDCYISNDSHSPVAMPVLKPLFNPSSKITNTTNHYSIVSRPKKATKIPQRPHQRPISTNGDMFLSRSMTSLVQPTVQDDDQKSKKHFHTQSSSQYLQTNPTQNHSSLSGKRLYQPKFKSKKK